MLVLTKKDLIIFGGAQLFIIFMVIYKENYRIQLSYALQKKERELKELQEDKKVLKLKLLEAHDHSVLKKNAKKKGMRSVRLSDMKKIYE